MNSFGVVENFFGVYLLKSLNPKYKGRTYIGYTVNPNRRIKQHNRGKEFGGAWQTSKRGPWEMVLTVHGFPSDVCALRFEWAWQHPKRSRRLKYIIMKKKSSETSLQYKIRIMFTMLSTPPWNRLPLTVRWLSADVVIEAPANLTPPSHIPVTYGSVLSKKVKRPMSSQNAEEVKGGEMEKTNLGNCRICQTTINDVDLLNCVNCKCDGSWHIFCLADKFLTEEAQFSNEGLEKGRKRIIPVEGSCPQCKSFILWGDLIKKRQGCFSEEVHSSSLASPLKTVRQSS